MVDVYVPVSLERTLRVIVPSAAVDPEPDARLPDGRVMVIETVALGTGLLF